MREAALLSIKAMAVSAASVALYVSSHLWCRLRPFQGPKVSVGGSEWTIELIRKTPC
jgi:hypothetical protein